MGETISNNGSGSYILLLPPQESLLIHFHQPFCYMYHYSSWVDVWSLTTWWFNEIWHTWLKNMCDIICVATMSPWWLLFCCKFWFLIELLMEWHVHICSHIPLECQSRCFWPGIMVVPFALAFNRKTCGRHVLPDIITIIMVTFGWKFWFPSEFLMKNFTFVPTPLSY